MATEPLTFALLEAQCSQYIRDEDDNTRLKGRWVFAIGLLIAGVSLLAAQVFQSHVALQVAAAGVLIECLGATIGVAYTARDAWQALREQRQKTAERLDRQYHQRQEVISWLSQFPMPEREKHLRYASNRKEVFAYRFGLIIGGMERFGLFPVLIVLYLQFKDWQFGDWHAFTQVHYMGGVLLVTMAGIYAIGWVALRDRNQIDVYEALLAESCVVQPE